MPKNKTGRIINAGADFKRFWELAQGKPFEAQARLWDEHVESRYQDVYGELVYSKKNDKDWRSRKEKLLRSALPRIGAACPAISSLFASFDEIAAGEMARFREIFPDAVFDYPIYAVPSLYVFDGRTGSLAGQNVLAFGVDALIAYKRDLHIMFSHECFHVYHMGAIGLNEAVFVEKARLSVALWLEGMATCVSGLANPGRGDAELLLSEKLGAVSAERVAGMARDFISAAELKVCADATRDTYNKWFCSGSSGADLERAGYRLGLEVVRHLARANDIRRMVKWGLDETHSNVLKTLSELAGSGRRGSGR